MSHQNSNIDTEQITSALNSHPSIKDSVVIEKPNLTDKPLLMAYFTSLLEIDRLLINIDCFIRCHDYKETTTTYDISKQGACISINHPEKFTMHEKVALKMSLPLLEGVTLSAKVSWISQDKIGLQFQEGEYENILKRSIHSISQNEWFSTAQVGRFLALDKHRKDFRVPYNNTCRLTHENETDKHTVTIQDFSCGGIHLQNCPSNWQAGDIVNIEFTVPNSQDILPLRGTIAWCRKSEIGVAFMANSSQTAKLAQCVTEITKQKNYFINMHTVSQLRHYLSQYLPESMIPNHYILLEEFPLTSTGEIDMAAIQDDFRASVSQTVFLFNATD